MPNWPKHVLRVGSINESWENDDQLPPPAELRPVIEPWLTAVAQSEHLGLLLGSGFTTAVAFEEGVSAQGMDVPILDLDYAEAVRTHAANTAKRMGRGEPNYEDFLRAALALQQGLEIMGDPRAPAWRLALNSAIVAFREAILQTEAALLPKLATPESTGMPLLLGFLLSFSSRAATRERLHVFTTNYDRLIEHGCDTLGVRVLDRFVGALTPRFRASRQTVDFHFSPPGIRGEPRYLEGVIRLTKLHGSIDWLLADQSLTRIALPFGAAEFPRDVFGDPLRQCMIYPNSSKDSETALFPYAELFRDFANAVCQPNATVVTYGYGFGDDHINRVLADMLTIPSTHLVVMSFNDPGGRIERFVKLTGRPAQFSLLIGPNFGSLSNLVSTYLPKPAIDQITARRTRLLEARGRTPPVDASSPAVASSTAEPSPLSPAPTSVLSNDDPQ